MQWHWHWWQWWPWQWWWWIIMTILICVNASIEVSTLVHLFLFTNHLQVLQSEVEQWMFNKKEHNCCFVKPSLIILSVSVLWFRSQAKLFDFLKVSKSKSKKPFNMINVHVRHRRNLYRQVTQIVFICLWWWKGTQQFILITIFNVSFKLEKKGSLMKRN